MPTLNEYLAQVSSNPMAVNKSGSFAASLPSGPVQAGPVNPRWMTGLGRVVGNALGSARDAFMAPGNALQGNYAPVVDASAPGGLDPYSPMIPAAMNMAGALTLGSGALPAEAGALNMGMKVYHGSPAKDLTELAQSTRGPLGPGVYATPYQPLAQRYAGADGRVYSFEAPDEMFHGMKPMDAGSDVNPYQTWRDQTAKLVAAAPADKQAAVAALMQKMSYDDGYPLFARLSNLMGGDAKAQQLLKDAGYHGMTGNIDGPEAVMFNNVPIPSARGSLNQ